MTKPEFPPLESLTPEQLLRLSRAFQKRGMKELNNPAERKRLFRVANLLRIGGTLKAKRLSKEVAKKQAQRLQNDKRVNVEAWRWLKEAKVQPGAHSLHLLTLAEWGMENGAEGDWQQDPDLTCAVEMQLGDLALRSPEDLMRWLFANPDEGDPHEQEQDLLHLLKTAEFVLCTIWLMMLQDAA